MTEALVRTPILSNWTGTSESVSTFFGRHRKLRSSLDTDDDGGDDAHFDVHGADDFAERVVLGGEPAGAGETAETAEQHGVRRADTAGEGTREQAAEGRHAH